MLDQLNTNYLGDKNISQEFKTAFLCSRKCPADIILKSLDWAKEKKNKGECVISGFHSKIEKDIFNILVRGKQPLIMAPARGMKKQWEPNVDIAIKNKKLFIIFPFEQDVTRVTEETSTLRNQFMADLADITFIAYATKGGKLDLLARDLLSRGKKVQTFNIKDNQWLIDLGAEGI